MVPKLVLESTAHGVLVAHLWVVGAAWGAGAVLDDVPGTAKGPRAAPAAAASSSDVIKLMPLALTDRGALSLDTAVARAAVMERVPRGWATGLDELIASESTGTQPGDGGAGSCPVVVPLYQGWPLPLPQRVAEAAGSPLRGEGAAGAGGSVFSMDAGGSARSPVPCVDTTGSQREVRAAIAARNVVWVTALCTGSWRWAARLQVQTRVGAALVRRLAVTGVVAVAAPQSDPSERSQHQQSVFATGSFNATSNTTVASARQSQKSPVRGTARSGFAPGGASARIRRKVEGLGSTMSLGTPPHSAPGKGGAGADTPTSSLEDDLLLLAASGTRVGFSTSFSIGSGGVKQG